MNPGDAVLPAEPHRRIVVIHDRAVLAEFSDEALRHNGVQALGDLEGLQAKVRKN
jgi:hypothetical protein